MALNAKVWGKFCKAYVPFLTNGKNYVQNFVFCNALNRIYASIHLWMDALKEPEALLKFPSHPVSLEDLPPYFHSERSVKEFSLTYHYSSPVGALQILSNGFLPDHHIGDPNFFLASCGRFMGFVRPSGSFQSGLGRPGPTVLDFRLISRKAL
ncbi:unnamed protein product [Dovyalis caffra]|uniref:Uncharacterized protein n=1 Tax=Dovyalis caffra TaxID=77055 RepID=A0AAV1RMM9_9ROSI|nr:unnamed protein product [Dovyalis caffra]